MKFQDMISQVVPCMVLIIFILHTLFSFAFVVPAREVSASWFLRFSPVSSELFTKEGSVGSTAFPYNLCLRALLSQCRYRRVLGWICWPSTAPLFLDFCRVVH